MATNPTITKNISNKLCTAFGIIVLNKIANKSATTPAFTLVIIPINFAFLEKLSKLL